MAGRDPFTDTFFAPEDPSCSPPKAFGGETQGPGFANLRNQVLSLIGRDREGLACRGPSVILGRKTERGILWREGLATPGYCDFPIGGPTLAVRENIVLGRSPPTILQKHTNTEKSKQTRTDDPRPRRSRRRLNASVPS